MKNCLFCKIANREIPSYKIYEDRYTYAFLDIAKDYPGHTLVVSKEHTKNLYSANKSIINHMNNTVNKIMKHYKSLGYDGFNVLTNVNPSSGQSVLHYHVHIIPRKTNDNVKVYTTPNDPNMDLESMAKKLALN